MTAALALCGVAQADEHAATAPAQAAPPEAPAAAGEGAGKQDGEDCTWGCLRWGKQCNVDPRGVYRCRRSCERFGQICE